MTRIGIECESTESPETWGVGRIVNKLLENIAARPELINEFRFFLYFKSHIPDLPYLNNPIFVKKIVGPNSFSLYYYIFLPVKLWFEKLDLVFFPNYMLPILFHGESLFILTEDIYYEIRRFDLRLRYKLAYKIFAEWWAARHASKIMAISETSRCELTKLFKISPDRIVVNTLGIDLPKIPPTNYKLPLLRPAFTKVSSGKQGFAGQATTNYLLYVGQAFPRRHLRETMLAFEVLASNATSYKLPLLRPAFTKVSSGKQGFAGRATTNYQLVAVGKDKYNPPIIEKLKNEINSRLGRNAIIYKEYVSEEELAQLYAGAKLLIYVSSKEAFGLPPLEALSYGIPAVVADQDVTREIFSTHAFFVANPDDPDSITSAIRDGLTEDTKRQEIKNASAGILEKYTWQKNTDRFLEIIRNFMMKKAAH